MKIREVGDCVEEEGDENVRKMEKVDESRGRRRGRRMKTGRRCSMRKIIIPSILQYSFLGRVVTY